MNKIRNIESQIVVNADGRTFSKGLRGTYNSCRDGDGYMCISSAELTEIRSKIEELIQESK